MIAKLQGAKRKRGDEDDDGEDVDMDGEGDGEDDGAEGWMDVDEDEGAPKKKVKTNAGRVINKRHPRSNRQMAGMRDEAVCSLFKTACWRNADQMFLSAAIQQGQPTTESRSTTTQHARESRRVRSRDQSQNGISSFAFCFLDFADMERPASAQTFILRKTERRKDEQALISVYPLLRFSILVHFACTTITLL